MLALFHNGWSINKSSDVFEKLAKLAFQQRKVLKIPFISRIQELIVSYLADGLYPAVNIEAGLQEAYGKERKKYSRLLLRNFDWNENWSACCHSPRETLKSAIHKLQRNRKAESKSA